MQGERLHMRHRVIEDGDEGDSEEPELKADPGDVFALKVMEAVNVIFELCFS
jgi:hypothetical protein